MVFCLAAPWGFLRKVAQGQKSPHEDFIMTFIVVFLVVAISWVIWAVFQVQLKEMLRWIRVAELWLGTFMHGGDHAVIHPSAGRQTIEVWREWLTEVKARDITVLDIKVSTQVAVEPIRHVFVAILGLLSIFIILKGPGTHYRRRMRLEELMREQAKSFPAIVPFLKFNPRDMPSRAPGAPVPAHLLHTLPYVASLFVLSLSYLRYRDSGAPAGLKAVMER